MAEVGGDCFRVHAGGDQEACEGVPAFVKADRLEPRLAPSSQSALADCCGRERSARGRAEDEALASPGGELVLDQQIAQCSDDRDARATSAALMSCSRAFETLRELVRACGFDLELTFVPYAVDEREAKQLRRSLMRAPQERLQAMLKERGR